MHNIYTLIDFACNLNVIFMAMDNVLYFVAPIFLSVIFSLLVAISFNLVYQRRLWVHEAKILFYQLFLFFVIVLSSNLELVLTNSISRLLILVSVILLVTTVISLGRKSFFPYAKPSKTNKLVTSGPFKIVRHPFYFALIIFCMAYVITMPILAIPLLALMYILDKKGSIEEEHLSQIYGQYKEYQKNTKKIIPFIY